MASASRNRATQIMPKSNTNHAVTISKSYQNHCKSLLVSVGFVMGPVSYSPASFGPERCSGCMQFHLNFHGNSSNNHSQFEAGGPIDAHAAGE